MNQLSVCRPLSDKISVAILYNGANDINYVLILVAHDIDYLAWLCRQPFPVDDVYYTKSSFIAH